MDLIKTITIIHKQLPLRKRRLATNLAKSKLFKSRMLYKTMLQKLKTLKMALIRRDVASDIVVCGVGGGGVMKYVQSSCNSQAA